jgi:DNA-binding CsgD family transcriptional regulator
VRATFLKVHGMNRHPLAIWYDKHRKDGTRLGPMPTLTRRQLIPDRDWYASVGYQEYHRLLGTDHHRLQAGADGRGTDDLPFPAQDRRRGRLLRPFGAARSPGALRTGASGRSGASFRRRPVQPDTAVAEGARDILLSAGGDREKQVASRLGLSRETVHQYVKALYRHYQVASRAELLARVLGRRNVGG